MEAHGVHYAEAMLYRERIQLKAVMLLLWRTYPEIRNASGGGFREPDLQSLYHAVMMAPDPPDAPYAPAVKVAP